MLRRPSRALLTAGVLGLAMLASPAVAADAVHLCLLAPHGETGRDGLVRAVVPLERPTIFAAEPLAELRLEQNGRLLWQRQAPLLEPIQGPQPWPLRPLRGGERLLLRLRPHGDPPGRFATIALEAASTTALQRQQATSLWMGRDGRRWQQAVEQAMEARDAALVAALLFAFEGPATPALDGLRRAAFEQGCDSGPEGRSDSVDPGSAPSP